MTKPTTIRLSEDLLKEIEQFVQEAHLDRSAYLREIFQKGFALTFNEKLLVLIMPASISALLVQVPDRQIL